MPQDLVNEIAKTINAAIERFEKSLPEAQEVSMREIELLLKDLELSQSRLKPNAANLRTIGKIKQKLEVAILNEGYLKAVEELIGDFRKISKLQTRYFHSLVTKFNAPKLLKELQKQSITAAIESLTGAGVDTNLVQPIQDILRQNITTGGIFSELTKTVREFIVGNLETVGHLERYVKQIANDALSQYAAQYLQVVAADLGLVWFRVVGAEIETTRDYCEATLDKRFIHRSEFEDLIRGNFPEFKAIDGKINSKTGLPRGMIAGTKPENLQIYRGGWNCGHQYVPVAEAAVPKKLRLEVYKSRGIMFDGKGFALAA